MLAQSSAASIEPVLVAPGREPDALDAIMAQMRAKTNVEQPWLRCRRCGKPKPPAAFKFSERGRVQPTCLDCAAAWMPRAAEPVRAITATDKPKSPLAPFVTYRRTVAKSAEEAAIDEEYAYRMAEMEAQGDLEALERQYWEAGRDDEPDTT